MDNRYEIIVEQRTFVDELGRVVIVYYDHFKEVEGIRPNRFGRLIWLTLPDVFGYTLEDDFTVVD